MNDKEMIEEMASDMNFACVKHDLYPDDAKEIAKALVILGYRNCKDKVVLRKEEFDEDYVTKQDRDYWKNKAEILGNKLKQARKETAKEIFTTIDHLIINDRATPLWVKYVLIEIAKKYGVEVEE